MHAANVISLIVVIIAIANATVYGSEQVSSQFAPTNDDKRVVQQLTREWSKVDCWMCEYQASASGSSDANIPVHKLMAMNGSGDYYHLMAHIADNIPWQMDPFSQELFIHDDEEVHSWPFNRAYGEDNIEVGDLMPGTTWMDVLMPILPTWPLSDYKLRLHPYSGTLITLIDAIKSPDFHLNSTTEIINGENCLLFDCNGYDRIWVATGRPLCLMRRDIFNRNSGQLYERILTDKLFEPTAGLWLPCDYRIQSFAENKSREGAKILRESHIHIIQFRVGREVSKAMFVHQILPGAIKFDEREHFKQISEGGEDLRSNIVRFFVECLHLDYRNTGSGSQVIRFFGAFAAGLGVSSLLIMVGHVCLSKMRGTRLGNGNSQAPRS